MHATLVGSAGPLAGREFSLEADVITIGRRNENDVVIRDPTVSRHHAEIRREGDDLILRDRESTSGTLVNGEPIAGERRLRDGDVITIGNSATFAVRLAADASEDAATIAFSRERITPPPMPVARAEAEDVAMGAPATRRDTEHTSILPPAERPGPEPPRRVEQPPAGEPFTGAGGGPGASPPPPVYREAPQPAAWSAPPAERQDADRTSLDQPAGPPPRDAGTPAAGSWSTPASTSTPPPLPPDFGAEARQPGGAYHAPTSNVPVSAIDSATPAVAAPVTPAAGSRRGLVIGLTVVLLLICVAIVVIGLLLLSRGGA